jgi:hypothetical protein
LQLCRNFFAVIAMRTSSEPLQGVQFWLDAERGDATVIDKILPASCFISGL